MLGCMVNSLVLLSLCPIRLYCTSALHNEPFAVLFSKNLLLFFIFSRHLIQEVVLILAMMRPLALRSTPLKTELKKKEKEEVCAPPPTPTTGILIILLGILVLKENYLCTASFEMMRKEQHKVLQEKQNQKEKAPKPSGDHLLDLLQSSTNSQGTISKKDEDLDGHVAPHDASNKPSLSRPLVPPGFASSSVGDKKLQKGSLNASTESEVMII